MTTNPLSPVHSPAFPAAVSPLALSRFSPVDPLRLARQYARLLVLVGIIGLILGTVLWGGLRYFTPEYTTYYQLAISAPVTGAYESLSDPGSSASDTLNAYIQNQIVRIKSDDVINDALKNEDLRKTSWFKSFDSDPGAAAAKAKEKLQRGGDLSATQLRGTTLLLVSLTGPRPKEDLPRVLDTIINVYMSRLRSEGETQSSDLRQAFMQERLRVDDDIKSIQNQIKQFAIDNDLPNLQAQNHEASIAYQMIADQAAKLRVGIQAARDNYRSLVQAQQQGSFNHTAQDIAEVEKDFAVASRDEKLRQLREDREVARQRFGDNHYYVKDIDRKILATQQERKQEMDRLLLEYEQVHIAEAKKIADGMEAQLAGLDPKLDEARAKMRDLNLKLQGYQNLADQEKMAIDRRDRLDKTLDEVRIRIGRPDFIRIHRQQTSTEPQLTFPLALVFIPGSFVLCLAGVGGSIYLKEMLDQRVKSPADVNLLPNLDLLGVLPEATDDPSNPARIESVVQDDPTGFMAESFRLLRTSLLLPMERQGLKTLVLACPQAESGVSSVASNLAMSLAYVGKRVLLIDANLRRPRQHYIFGIAQQPGLIEVLRGATPLATAIFHKVEPKIDILPVGDIKDIPPEMLEGAAFRTLLNQAEPLYDVILIDTAPALLTSDSQMLAKHADAVLVVVRALSDKRGMVNRMVRQFEGQHARVLGAVLNRARSSAGGYFRQTYENFYNYKQNPPEPKGSAGAGAKKSAAVGSGQK